MHCNNPGKMPPLIKPSLDTHNVCLHIFYMYDDIKCHYVPGSISAHRVSWNRARGTQAELQILGYKSYMKFRTPSSCCTDNTYIF